MSQKSESGGMMVDAEVVRMVKSHGSNSWSLVSAAPKPPGLANQRRPARNEAPASTSRCSTAKSHHPSAHRFSWQGEFHDEPSVRRLQTRQQAKQQKELWHSTLGKAEAGAIGSARRTINIPDDSSYTPHCYLYPAPPQPVASSPPRTARPTQGKQESAEQVKERLAIKESISSFERTQMLQRRDDHLPPIDPDSSDDDANTTRPDSLSPLESGRVTTNEPRANNTKRRGTSSSLNSPRKGTVRRNTGPSAAALQIIKNIKGNSMGNNASASAGYFSAKRSRTFEVHPCAGLFVDQPPADIIHRYKSFCHEERMLILHRVQTDRRGSRAAPPPDTAEESIVLSNDAAPVTNSNDGSFATGVSRVQQMMTSSSGTEHFSGPIVGDVPFFQTLLGYLVPNITFSEEYATDIMAAVIGYAGSNALGHSLLVEKNIVSATTCEGIPRAPPVYQESRPVVRFTHLFSCIADHVLPPIILRNVAFILRCFDPSGIGSVPHYLFARPEFLRKFVDRHVWKAAQPQWQTFTKIIAELLHKAAVTANEYDRIQKERRKSRRGSRRMSVAALMSGSGLAPHRSSSLLLAEEPQERETLFAWALRTFVLKHDPQVIHANSIATSAMLAASAIGEAVGTLPSGPVFPVPYNDARAILMGTPELLHWLRDHDMTFPLPENGNVLGSGNHHGTKTHDEGGI